MVVLVIGAIEVSILPFLLCLSLCARVVKKKISVGLGPHPLINNIYHKKALMGCGYTAETFVFEPYYLTQDFDIKSSDLIPFFVRFLRPYYLFTISVFRYGALYIYFNGGPLGVMCVSRFFEPFLYKLANVKVVVMPYGADVQDMMHGNNLLFKNAMGQDYPNFQKFKRDLVRKNVRLWSEYADHIISGCDWVYYMYHWDTLTLGHFSIDVNDLLPLAAEVECPEQPMTILHAPNHARIKGTKHFRRAVEELRAEGFDIELILVEKVPNDELKHLMRKADVIADQLVIGWYAMTALEAMCFEKPVLCYLDPNLLALYVEEGLLCSADDVPIVNCDFMNVKEQIKYLYDNPQERVRIGKAGRKYVEKYHSIENVGQIFDRINQNVGITKL